MSDNLPGEGKCQIPERPKQADNLVSALAKARAEFTTIAKDREVNAGAMRYKYADLATVLEAVTPALSKNGLVISQTFRPEGEWLHIVTTLMHTGGEKLESVYPIKLGANHQQNGAGAAYARRYSVSAILSVVAEDDTDGHEVRAKAEKAPKAEKLTPEQEAQRWIASQKDIIGGFPDRVLYSEWSAKNRAALDRLAKNHPKLHEDFTAWTDNWYNSKS